MARPVDGASLALFRICFGLVYVYEALFYLWPRRDGTFASLVFSSDTFHFSYPGFAWLQPWPEPWLHVHFVILGIAGLLMALGLFYRTAATTAFLCFTCVFLWDRAWYLNHFYLMCLVSFLLILMPATRCFSVESWLRRRKQREKDSSHWIPFWPVFLLRAQLFIVYFYAGIAKIDAEWLGGNAMMGPGRKLHEFLGGLVAVPSWLGVEQCALFVSWTGLIFDLAIGFLLLTRRTRFLAILLVAIFHGVNHFLFPIGVFPTMAFATTLIFFDADWPRKLFAWLRRPRIGKPNLAWLVGGAVAVPAIGAALGWKFGATNKSEQGKRLVLSGVVPAFVAVWLAFHCLVPFRHYFIPGDSCWTEEGHEFSWRMMLKSKRVLHFQMNVEDPEFLTTDDTGDPTFNWQAWPDRWAKVLHIVVDGNQVKWSRLPDLVYVYEPCVGVRVMYNPHAASSKKKKSLDEEAKAVGEHWQHIYGRKPQVTKTISLAQSLKNIHARLNEIEDDPDHDRDAIALHRKGLGGAQNRLPSKVLRSGAPVSEAETKMIELTDILQTMVDSKYGEVVREELARTHPFAIQGSLRADEGFMAVIDAGLDKENLYFELAKLHDGKPYSLLVDLRRLRADGWRGLQPALPCVEQGRIRVAWNYNHDLIHKHVKRMGENPILIHQYANHAADVWQQASGRRPKVNVLSLTKFNRHKPQLLIDPTADLASEPLAALSHNEWIMPLGREPSARSAKPNAVALNRRPAKPPAAKKFGQEKLIENFPDGSKKKAVVWKDSHSYVVTKWYDNGKTALVAEYSNDLPHGKQSKWHRDGTLAMEMNYRHGKLHGHVVRWHADGSRAEEGKFADGRQIGPWKTWPRGGGLRQAAKPDDGTR